MNKETIGKGIEAGDEIKKLFNDLSILDEIKSEIDDVEEIKGSLLNHYDRVKIELRKSNTNMFLELTLDIGKISPEMRRKCEIFFKELHGDLEKNVNERLYSIIESLDDLTSSSSIPNAKEGTDDEDDE